MDCEETGVSGPLKHLLSIDWENGVEIPHESEARKNHKPCKKVRFAEELEHLKFIDFDDRQECDDGQIGDYERSIEESGSSVLEKLLQFENEEERTLSQIDYEEKRESAIITGICQQVNSISVNVSPSIDGSVEVSQEEFPLENQNESATICTNLALNSTYFNSIDTNFENWRGPEKSEQAQLFKMALKKSIIERQSSKINFLLGKNNFTCARATEFQKAIFQAWCEVKNEQKMEKTKKNNPLTNKNVDKEEKTNIHSAFMKWKKSKRVQKRENMQSKINLDPCTGAPNLKDKEEAEAVFKMWKKKKDAILTKRKSEGSRLEQEQNVNSLMNAELQKEEAELAFAAWKYRKYEHLKKEKQKQVWMQLKKEEKDLIQYKRNEEALNAYLKWLEKKEYSSTYAKHNELLAEDSKQKTPWYP